ncbi:Uncharacterized protein AArcCO_1609 [Halalkaliarchaeum sp. AArc-CO]|uniref:hypothetical protein n=1 Tax=unclassified Halalkaliarchaeum TaxID=2678344 RepID=UPI00217D3F41|nr:MULTISPECIES: hypothetical protein [unclassified Halalkaliarchaeum]MDR5674193.1 hypothetical protein [Halalkaliarchaeum sp. AArc-GB]UWG50911.1 Uncharacterized protein AArcCO_1609 [Halalkaliarchaeum sp. AArc-CO]
MNSDDRTTGRGSDRPQSRRTILSAVATGVTSLAASLSGCLSLPSDDPPPIGVDEEELREIAAIDVPEVTDRLPVSLGDGSVEESWDRFESLLDPIPSDLAPEIPNEAVRSYIADYRQRARERLTDLEEVESNYDRLTTLGRSRRDAAEAEAAYAVATAGRVREDVYEVVESVDRTRQEIESDLEQTGDVIHEAVLVYDAIEAGLDSLEGRLDRVDTQSPLTSEVEAVGEAAGRLESSRARLELVELLLDRQKQGSDTPLDEPIERATSELLAEIDPNVEALPPADSDPEEVFDVPVAGTPREIVVDGIGGSDVLRTIYRYRSRVDDHLENDRDARALLALYELEHERRTFERLRDRISEGDLDRPDDVEAVADVKRSAIEAIEAALDVDSYPHLIGNRISASVAAIGLADRDLEEGRYGGDRGAVYAMGHYEVGGERARTLPETAAWFADALESA